jgi:eukaryotic-like serine/threonine-protein kinase
MDTTHPDTTIATTSDPSEQVLGALATRYDLLGEVGRGGMGVVYKARHRMLDKLVALKVTLPGAPIDRFLREARLAAQIRSPHVVAVHDCDVLPDGWPLLVMEWIEGTTLQAQIGTCGGLAENVVLPWMQQTAAGMLAAADLGIIHRDLKPSNILIDTRGQAQVVDFGLARGPGGAGELTLPGLGVMGTPYYMAPEQAEDPRGVDTRADIYSFGATFYHALTGVTPFDGQTAFTVLFRHKTEPLVPPRARNPQISEHVNAVLERCLAKAPGDRFPSFAEVARQLAPEPAPVSPWEDLADERLTSYLTRYQERREVYLRQRDTMTEPDAYHFPGERVLLVMAGDLVQQPVDALVSSEDGHLTMGESVPAGCVSQGVASALRRAAGPGYVAEARRFVPVRPGRVVVTPAGTLPVRYVFHGITLEGAVENRVCPSRDLIAEIITACFYHADSLYVRSMALPLLGTGAGGFSEEVCLDTMFRLLARMLLRGLTTVREVRLVLYRREQ